MALAEEARAGPAGLTVDSEGGGSGSFLLVGRGSLLGVVAGKAAFMYVTAPVGLRLGERRALAQWTIIDFATAVALTVSPALWRRPASGSPGSGSTEPGNGARVNILNPRIITRGGELHDTVGQVELLEIVATPCCTAS